ncbi:P-loop nucleoside triphosphate hydrolase [Rhizoctonia solani 123E]|uniref:p-loop nucleoside triphosphate hydrolase n=1 Tax=Rhizoctonia solani 123E TaxID=1423351 RepID=A0A074S2R0_9AGAM|nr:P-loop nucleoside triphosphate hydrolase [Rhizoctonia solani 123E]
MSAPRPKKVLLVGIGGPTCSGKTTLAKYLRAILPNSFIIHQDDFAPPQEQIPMHPVYNVQDWDDAPGAIDWPRLRASLKHVKDHGILPGSHSSHDHLNEQREVPIPRGMLERWKLQLHEVESQWSSKGVDIIWALLDGFLLYWDKEVVGHLDVKIFLHVSGDVLRKRRHERHGYHTAEGALWRDPPNYWEQIVYPAYIQAHKHLFKNEDVEKGDLTSEYASDLLLLRGEGYGDQTRDMGQMVEASAERIISVSSP